jgi:hypothetical protein
MNEAMEYQAQMQQSALAFLHRHQAEHLADDGALFERATGYLVNSLEVPVFLAPRLVHLAMSELGNRAQTTFLGIDLASGADHTCVVLIDTRTGERAYIPRRILPGRFLASHTL